MDTAPEGASHPGKALCGQTFPRDSAARLRGGVLCRPAKGELCTSSLRHHGVNDPGGGPRFAFQAAMGSFTPWC
jgi:hypothetical protein